EGDDAVDATIARSADALQVGAAGAVSRRVQDVEHELLEEARAARSDRVEQLLRDGVVMLADRCVDPLLGRLLGLLGALVRLRLGSFFLRAHGITGPAGELELLFASEAVRVLRQEREPARSNGAGPALRSLHEPEVLQHVEAPPDPVLIL